MTEEETKLKIITPSILKTWNIDNIKMETRTPSGGFMDYALYINNRLIAVVEAKSYNFDDEKGLNQAISYALECGAYFAYSSSGHSFIEYNLQTNEKKQIPIDLFPSPQELVLWSTTFMDNRESSSIPIINDLQKNNDNIETIKLQKLINDMNKELSIIDNFVNDNIEMLQEESDLESTSFILDEIKYIENMLYKQEDINTNNNIYFYEDVEYCKEIYNNYECIEDENLPVLLKEYKMFIEVHNICIISKKYLENRKNELEQLPNSNFYDLLNIKYHQIQESNINLNKLQEVIISFLDNELHKVSSHLKNVSVLGNKQNCDIPNKELGEKNIYEFSKIYNDRLQYESIYMIEITNIEEIENRIRNILIKNRNISYYKLNEYKNVIISYIKNISNIHYNIMQFKINSESFCTNLYNYYFSNILWCLSTNLYHEMNYVLSKLIESLNVIDYYLSSSIFIKLGLSTNISGINIAFDILELNPTDYIKIGIPLQFKSRLFLIS